MSILSKKIFPKFEHNEGYQAFFVSYAEKEHSPTSESITFTFKFTPSGREESQMCFISTRTTTKAGVTKTSTNDQITPFVTRMLKQQGLEVSESGDSLEDLLNSLVGCEFRIYPQYKTYQDATGKTQNSREFWFTPSTDSTPTQTPTDSSTDSPDEEAY